MLNLLFIICEKIEKKKLRNMQYSSNNARSPWAEKVKGPFDTAHCDNAFRK